MKVGIVGLGSIGARHASNFSRLGHQVVGYDPAKVSNVPYERDIYEMCDAVVIATPTMFHQSGLRACIERGKPVLVEKPLGLNAVPIYSELIRWAEVKKVPVMMGNNLRFHPGVVEAKHWLEAGDIGDVRWAHFTCSQETSKKTYVDDGVLFNTGGHEIDLALHLLGPGGVARAYRAEQAQIAELVMEHQGGCVSSLSLNYMSKEYIREIRIVGEKGDIHLDLVNRTGKFGHSHKFFSGNWDTDYYSEAQAFINLCHGGQNYGATGEDGLNVLAILCLAEMKSQ